MKSFFIILLLTLSQYVNAQDYEFDSMTLYSTKSNQLESKVLNYTNSKVNDYVLKMFTNVEYPEARLYDYKNNKVHYFKISEVKLKNEVTTNFIYETSYKFETGEEYYPKYVYDFETVEENVDFKNVKLSVYKNSKRKKSIAHFDLKMKPNDSNLFHAFGVSCIHRFNFVQNFNIDGNYIVESAKIITSDGQIIEHTLLEYKKVNLRLKIQ